MSNEVYKNDTAIVLDWNNISGADLYHLQVSVDTPDFGGSLEQDDNALGASTKSFTDGGTDDRKRFWRWRYSTDTGTTWSEWSEVGSYWLNTSGGGDVSITADGWKIFDVSDVTDIYTLDLNPVYSVVAAKLPRLFKRNRSGELLSEFITLKSKITLAFQGEQYIERDQVMAFRRFNSEIKTFFLSANKTNGIDDVPNIWKVQFEDDPEFTMIIAGRQDLWTGEISFVEV